MRRASVFKPGAPLCLPTVYCLLPTAYSKKGQLRVVARGLFGLAALRFVGGVGAVEGAVDGLEVEAEQARGEPDERDTALAREAARGRFADLQDLRELARRQELLARLFPVRVRVLHTCSYFFGWSESATR